MRKQYHSKLSERGCLIWDVDRLVALTSQLPIIEVPLSDIRELDETYWFDGDSPPPTCRAVMEHARLINETDLKYPIILGSNGRVMDGMHRVAKAAMLNHHSIAARRFSVDPEPDYVDVSLESLSYEETTQHQP
jgi:hypothetical protein